VDSSIFLTCLQKRVSVKLPGSGFRKVKDDGFSCSISIYMRFVPVEKIPKYKAEWKKLLEHGKIGVMQITDKQFGMMELFMENQ
jgi:CRISPR-associated protein Cas2